MVVYLCLTFCRSFNKLPSEVDNEALEDMFDMLIVAGLTSGDSGPGEQAKLVYADQVGFF